jgi:hypothetical protein
MITTKDRIFRLPRGSERGSAIPSSLTSGSGKDVPRRRSMPQQTVHLLLSVLYRMRLPGLALCAHLTCWSGFVTCREEAVLVMLLPGLVLCSRAVARRRAKHRHTQFCLQHPSNGARSSRPRPRRGGPPPSACTYGTLAGGGMEPYQSRPPHSSVSPLDGRRYTEVMGWTRQNGWRRIGLDDERPNEKVALPQASLTSCEVIGTPRRALQFPRHLSDSSIAPPLLPFSRCNSGRRRDAQTPPLFPFSRCHQAERRTNPPSSVPRR